MAGIGIATLLFAVLAGTATWRLRSAIRSRYETDANRASRDDEVLNGAEAISLGHGGRGVLLLHGFGDTPQSVRDLSLALHERGWTVRAPRLHGHGSSLSAFTSARASDWLADARSALDELRAHASPVAVIGQSMGGSLATILASESALHAMVLLAPFVRLTRRGVRIGRFHRLIAAFVPYLRSRSELSILDPEARRRALVRGVTTPRLIHELSIIVGVAWRCAPSVRVPTLVIHSPQDPRVTSSDATEAFARIGSPEKALKWAQRSGHVLSVDHDRDWIRTEVLAWLDAHATTP